ncbi:hypothetical protein BJ912DRAFT_995531 [Pholiota molesta]|nr:hypothetical protein BJ912DRAFT_995531 [Pholiota molesta]
MEEQGRIEIQPNRHHTKKRGQGKKFGRTPHTPPMPPAKRKRSRSPAQASRRPRRRRMTDPRPSVEGDTRYGDAQPRPTGSALPEPSAEWPAQAIGGPSTSRQHDHPLATENSEEEASAMGSLRSDHLRSALTRDLAGRSRSPRDHHHHHPPTREDEAGPMVPLQWDHVSAAMQEIQDHDHAIAGRPTSHRDQIRHPPATEEVGPTARPQGHLARAAHCPSVRSDAPEWPAQATGGPSTSRQHDHPLATEVSDEEEWAISSLETDSLRAVVRGIQAHTAAGRSTSDRDRLRAALREERFREHAAAAGRSTSRRDQRRHPPATDEEAGPMASPAPQLRLPRASHYRHGESITCFTRHPGFDSLDIQKLHEQCTQMVPPKGGTAKQLYDLGAP